MKRSRLCWIVGVSLGVSACASFEPRIDPWPGPLETEIAEPVPLPDWPEGISDDLTLTVEQATRILNFRDLAYENYDIARDLSKGASDLLDSRNALARSGHAEFELSELRGRMLEEERRGRMWDKAQYISLIVAGLVIGATR